MDFNSLRMVPVDLFHRHFLVYDEEFKKIGTVDLRRGIWTFTLARNSVSFFGFSREDAVRAWIRFESNSSFPTFSPPEPVLSPQAAL